MIMNLWFPCQHLLNLESIKIIFAQFISFHYIIFISLHGLYVWDQISSVFIKAIEEDKG